MISCCFIIKTLLSLIAIWPAALVVHFIENGQKENFSRLLTKITNPIRFFNDLFKIAWNAKGYIYNLEAINIETKKATLYYKGTRGVVCLSLEKLIFDLPIINKIRSIDAAHIGYYYALIEYHSFKTPLLKDEKPSKNGENLLTIKAIDRDGKLSIEDLKNKIYFKKTAIEIFKNQKMLEKFSSIQAMYIGYLSGIASHFSKDSFKVIPHLKLIK